MSLEVGQLLDNKYRIIRLIGEGGMGAVFEGENLRINRRVAIKVLHAAFTDNAEVMLRFEREAQAAGRIGNDHILEVLDLGVLPDGDRYIIMELLDGEPLSSRIKLRGYMTPHDFAPLMRQVLVGLGAAHAVGIIHRDLKPDNIFIQREKAGQKDYVKIIDFGISKFQPLSGDGMKMTRTGAVMGTPYYMSPEQASGSAEADARSDVYSLGVIMYEAVTGQVPFDAGTFNQLMFKIVLAEIPPPNSIRPDLDPAFASIILKAMARDVDHRFQSTSELLAAIEAWQSSGQSVTVPPAAGDFAGRHLPGGARKPMGSEAGLAAAAGSGQRTAGSWATSQHGVLPAKKKSALSVIAALSGTLLVLGAAVVAFSTHGKGAKTTEIASASPAIQTPRAVPTPAPAPAGPIPAAALPFSLPEDKALAAAAPEPSTSGRAKPAASGAPAALAVHSVLPARATTHAEKNSLAAPKPAPAASSAHSANKKSSVPDFGY